jgi:serine/threonine protein kinase
MKSLLTAQGRCPGIDIYPWRGDDTWGSERGTISGHKLLAHLLTRFLSKANILIDQDGHARLADFGLLTVSDSTHTTISSSSKFGGTYGG